jgi:spoIIIJ-associated protein
LESSPARAEAGPEYPGEEKMNERANLEKIAPTVEEAVAEGLVELGLTEEFVDVEVLDGGSRGLLGIGGRQARVRLTIKETPVMEPTTDQASPAVEDDEMLSLVRRIVNELLEQMKVSASVDVHYGVPEENGETPIMVDITGPDLGILIGRRAEILNAIQYLVNLMVSKKMEHWVQVVVDVEGYRTRHERQLRQLAQRMADQVMKTGRRQSLEPMPASDRRIIHLELRDHPSVITQSVGEEPVRKVTIVPKQ